MIDEEIKSASPFGGSFSGRFYMRDEGNSLGFSMLFACCVYVSQVSMAMVTLLHDAVAFVGLSRLNVWCALLMLINCRTLLLMEDQTGRILINRQILLRYVKRSATNIQSVVGGLFNRVWSANDQAEFSSIFAMFYFRMVGDNIQTMRPQPLRGVRTISFLIGMNSVNDH
jgi:hypothetical protein